MERVTEWSCERPQTKRFALLRFLTIVVCNPIYELHAQIFP